MTGIEIAAVSLAVAGAAAGTVGAISAGQQQGAIAEFNAAQAEREAEQLSAITGFEEGEIRRRTRSLIGRQRAAAGASGLVVNEGSPLEAQLDAAEEGELDALAIRFSGSVAEAQRRSEAALSRFQGRAARTQGFLRGAQTLLTGGSRAASILV